MKDYKTLKRECEALRKELAVVRAELDFCRSRRDAAYLRRLKDQRSPEFTLAAWSALSIIAVGLINAVVLVALGVAGL